MEIFPLLVHSPEGHSGQRWGSLKEVVSSGSLTLEAWTQTLGSFFAAFLMPLTGIWLRVGEARTNQCPYRFWYRSAA